MVKVDGQKISSLRKLKRLTQEELADVIGVSIQYISQVENGKKGASVYTLKKLADLFQITIEELIRTENLNGK